MSVPAALVPVDHVLPESHQVLIMDGTLFLQKSQENYHEKYSTPSRGSKYLSSRLLKTFPPPLSIFSQSG
jgi:hypothetical protein